MFIRMRKREKLDKQAIRAPTVADEGSRPGAPMPWAQARTWADVTVSGEPTRPKNGHSIRA